MAGDLVHGPPNKIRKTSDAPVFGSSESPPGSSHDIKNKSEGLCLSSDVQFRPSTQRWERKHSYEARQQNVYTNYSVGANYTTKLQQSSFYTQLVQTQTCFPRRPIYELPDHGSVAELQRTFHFSESSVNATGMKSLHSANVTSSCAAVNETDIPGKTTSLHDIRLTNCSIIPTTLPNSSANNLINSPGKMKVNKNLLTKRTSKNYSSGSQGEWITTNEANGSPGSLIDSTHVILSNPGSVARAGHTTSDTSTPASFTQNAAGHLVNSIHNTTPEVLVDGKTQQKIEGSSNCFSSLVPPSQDELINTSQVSTNGQQTIKKTDVGSSQTVRVDTVLPNPARQNLKEQDVPQQGSRSTSNTPFLLTSITALNTDSEKELIQKQRQLLKLLLHADNCQRRQNKNGGASQCSFTGCQTMKNLLIHTTTCKAGTGCMFPLCSISRRLLSHKHNCILNDCQICSEVKQALHISQHQDSSSSESHSNVSSATDSASISTGIPNNAECIKPTNAVCHATNFQELQLKKVLTPDDLRKALMPSFKKLLSRGLESLRFKQPLDPELMIENEKNSYIKLNGSLYYFDTVKNPPDIQTIKQKLDSGQYLDPWQYIEDIWLVFSYAWLYNRQKSSTYRYCTKLAQIFEQEINLAMQSLGYCCGGRYVFHPKVLRCYGKDLCIIPRREKYWSYQNSNAKKYGQFVERYMYCKQCFSEIPGDTVTIEDEKPVIIRKEMFVEMTNNHIEKEPFAVCKKCARKFHEICVLHLPASWPKGFTCNNCLKREGLDRKINRFTAKNLPQTKLGDFIEKRVKALLYQKRYDDDDDDAEITIRVVSSSDKYLKVKPAMKRKFVDAGEFPESFPYRAKAIFAFQEIDGVDVCFFGMHVQEYGSQCSAPNTRRIYIAYLDSVHFFRPKRLRTAVYHEIVLGYLDYARRLGYTVAHIWAVPPSQGDDYIFYFHPSEQKIPTPKRLQQWYKVMFRKGIADGIIHDYNDILKEAIQENLTNASHLPYFEGDFWPGFLEDTINKLTKKEVNSKSEDAPHSSEISCCSGERLDNHKCTSVNKAQCSRPPKNSHKGKFNSSGNDLTEKIYSAMEEHKEVFFVIHLRSVQGVFCLPETEDPDPVITCELMNGRDAFLTLAREKYLEFSSLRRAKYSTMAMLYEMNNESQACIRYMCNNCGTYEGSSLHCTVCADLDLCLSCFDKVGHQHKMEKIAVDVGADNRKQSKETRLRSIENRTETLIHVSTCKNERCVLHGCNKLKRMINHGPNCKQSSTGGCILCKFLFYLCCRHAKFCEDDNCPVVCCLKIRDAWKKQQLQQRLQQEHSFKRRIANMRGTVLYTCLPQTSPENSDLASQPSCSASFYSSPNSPCPSTGVKLSFCPPGASLPVVPQEATESPSIQQLHGNPPAYISK